MRVLFLTSGDRVPSTRFRILPFLDYLRQDGIRCDVGSSVPQKYDHWPWLGFRPSQKLKRIVRWMHLLQARLRRYDVVFVERELFNDATIDMEQRFRRIAPAMVLDVDDAIFLRQPDKTQRLAQMADVVIAGNPPLRDVLSDWNDRIVTIPTGVRLAAFPEKDWQARDSDVPVVGWMGTRGNLEYLNVVAPALRSLARRLQFELRVIVPDIAPLAQIPLDGVRIRHVPWRGDAEVEQLRAIDIGLMPLYDDRPWDRYKCPTKLVQYMAIGVPGVASPVGFTGQVVTHGVDGFLAAGTAQWEQSLERLIGDPELRQTIGQAGRRTVAAKYCVEANWPLLAAAIRTAADMR